MVFKVIFFPFMRVFRMFETLRIKIFVYFFNFKYIMTLLKVYN